MPQPMTIDRLERQWKLILTAIATLALPSVVVLVSNDPASLDPSARQWNGIGLVACLIVGQGISHLLHPYRSRGLVTIGAFAWCVVAVIAALRGEFNGWAFGLPLGLVWGGLNRIPGSSFSWRELLVLLIVFLIGVTIVAEDLKRVTPENWNAWFVVFVAGMLTVMAVLCLFRPTFELLCEPVLWLMYSVRSTGPGLKSMPATGPCLVIANHACWFDPLLLAKVLPRRVTPMMTARFYNLPVIHWFMRRFGVIRVNEQAIRREMPEELGEAIAALDRGECILIFPESYLRRTEERILRRFARGIWQILDARPNTPIFCCWLEGTWGSYTSYHNGPPTKNKKKDFRRPIRIAVSDSVLVPNDALKEHLKTRMYLMNEVVSARALLGMPALPRFELPDDEKEGTTQS